MRILQTVFDLNDYGGIVNYVEILHEAFLELGHECETVVLRDSTRDPYTIKPTTPTVGNYKSKVASRAHVTQGWYGIPVYSYGDARTRKIWRKFAEGFDLIIHQIPNPKWDSRGAWRKLYDVNPPQIIATHDAHFRVLYPYMIDVADKIMAITAAQEAGYNALAHFPAPRSFVGCPMQLKNWRTQHAWEHRQRQFVSAHVWKAWKRMHLIVRAIPHIRHSTNIIAGDGIEGRYMRSVDKCKPVYKGIWKQALKAGMQYQGFISPTKLAKFYQRSRVMVDLSWSKHHAELGNHFNYSTLEALNNGCIPICVAESMHETHQTQRMFEEGSTHFAVAADWGPEEIAYTIDKVTGIKAAKARTIVANGQDLLRRLCSHTQCAEWFLRLAQGRTKDVGIYGRAEFGKVTADMQRARDTYVARAEARAT